MKQVLAAALLLSVCSCGSTSGGDTDGTGASGGYGGEPGDPDELSCLSESDCKAFETAHVENCAYVDCKHKAKGQCILVALDIDGDGAPGRCIPSDTRIRVQQSPDTIVVREDVWDCDPFNGTVYPKAWDGPPGLHEDSCNGIDNNCNHLNDDSVDDDGASCTCAPDQVRDCALVDSDQDSQAQVPDKLLVANFDTPNELIGSCQLGTTECNTAGKWGLCVNAHGPTAEACDALNRDLNCNGINGIDELDLVDSATKVSFLCDDDADDQVPSDARKISACIQDERTLPSNECGQWLVASTINRLAIDCNDQNDEIHVGALESCDGIDSNCDGESDLTDPLVKLPESGGENVHGYECVASGDAQPLHPSLDCNAGYANCDGYGNDGITSGCEIDIRTVANCGACGTKCDFACSGTDPNAFGCAEIESFSTGRAHTCATLSDGRVSCWGAGTEGQLGYGGILGKESPVAALDIGISVAPASFVAAGGDHTCAVIETGEVYCWGSGSKKQNGTINEKTLDLPRPEEMPDTVGDAVSLGLGLEHSCAALKTGAIKCWGNQLSGRFGSGGLVLDEAGDPVTSGISTAHPAKINLSGEVDPEDGGISEGGGNGAGGSTDADQAWRFFSSAKQVVAGVAHTCALEDGRVYCAGDNTSFQLGIGENQEITHSLYFVQVPGLEGVSQIASGADFSCALKQGEVYCWGANFSGQIGRSYYDQDAFGSPTQIENLSNVTQLTLGGVFACALSEREVYCWGDGSFGQLGTPEYYYYSLNHIPSLSGATMIHAGANHACALLKGKLACWGDNSFGQLGRSKRDEDPHYEPDTVTPLGPVVP